jgi:hypothetical protein
MKILFGVAIACLCMKGQNKNNQQAAGVDND